MKLDQMNELLKKRFDDSEANSPLDFKYVGKLRSLLSVIGSWPHKQFGRVRLDAVLSAYSRLLTFMACVLSTLAAAYLWSYRHDMTFFDMGHIVLTICLDVLYLQRLVVAQTDKYREAVKDFLLEFHLFYFKHRSQYSAKIFSQTHIISGMFTLYSICLLFGGMSLFIFTPLYNNYRRGMFGEGRPPNSTFEHAVYYYSPVEDLYTTEKGFWILFVFNIYNSLNVTCGLMLLDLLLSLIVFQIWGHLKILKHHLLTFPPPAASNGMYSVQENVQIKQLLMENIVHHNFIIQFVDKCSNAFSEYLFIFYLLLQLISCILLLEVSSLTAEALAKYGPLTVAMHQQLIQVSILFEMINTKSEQLIDAVYELPWECMDTSNRKTVLFLLHRVQTPLSLKAAKVVPVGVQTMLGVLKTTYSYYMMLSTVARGK